MGWSATFPRPAAWRRNAPRPNPARAIPYELVSNRRDTAESFEALAMPLLASLYNLAHWLTQNRDEAEDLVQETYLKALKGFASFEPGTNLRAWMYRILRNTFLTSRTGLSVKMTVPLDLDDASNLPEVSTTPESVLLARADQQAVQDALQQLPLPFREVILLCDLEEMSYQEIAEALAIPAGTVMSRLSRARKAMRELLSAKVRGASQ
jgi:RNA polymerase sigma-70 factor, ECF subfamily